jgi:octaprenyl-diphosphate synthase
MQSVDQIKKSISNELQEFETFFKTEIKSQAYLLNTITKYILKTKGKQMRPMLVFLSAKLHGNISKSTYSAAFLIELMHTATLIHDDVVDDSMTRRGLFSVNALWKNKIAVLVGDFFLSKGLLHAVREKEFTLLEIVSDAVKEMSEGELIQMEKARMLNITEDIYFEIIEKKTASLIAAAMLAGARSVSDDENSDLLKIKKIGILIGLAFQIKDDIFDYEQVSLIGKPTGNDIKERKITLPLLHVISKSNSEEKKWIYSILKKHNTDTQKVKSLIDFVKTNGGIEYSIDKMNSLKGEALTLLHSYPESDAREAFESLIQYITDRKK